MAYKVNFSYLFLKCFKPAYSFCFRNYRYDMFFLNKHFHKDLYIQGFSDYYFSGEQQDMHAAHCYRKNMTFSLHTESISSSELSYQQYRLIIYGFRKKIISKSLRSLIIPYGFSIKAGDELNLVFQGIRLAPVRVGYLG